MTPLQYERWQDFALRMARTYPGRAKAYREQLEAVVARFLAEYTSNGEDIDDIGGWDGPGNGNGCAGDHASAFAEDVLEQEFGAPDYHDGRTGNGPTRAFERWEERYVSPFRCCVRAGLDLASEPSCGVIGFTAGDLKRMYPEGIPAWVSEGYEKDGAPLDLNALSSDEGVWL